MCNRYENPEEQEIRRHWEVSRDQAGRWWDEALFPRGQGVFIRCNPDGGSSQRELVTGQ